MQSSCGVRTDVSSVDDLKRKSLFQCLDRIMNELKQRSSLSYLLMGIQTCIPASDDILSEQRLAAIADHYKIQLKPEEVLVPKNFLADKERGWSHSWHIKCKLLDRDAFPSLKRFVQVALTVTGPSVH